MSAHTQSPRALQPIEQIAALLDGLPLLLEIAGQALTSMSPNELHARLKRDPLALMREPRAPEQDGLHASERPAAQLVQRVVDTIANWGKKDGYFKSALDAENFRMELAHLMLTQKACFNSPVWFNVGVKEPRGYGWYYDETIDAVKPLNKDLKRPQCSACFIVSVKDSLESILDLAKTEGMLFKWGSGTGTNLSKLREEEAILSGGGRARIGDANRISRLTIEVAAFGASDLGLNFWSEDFELSRMFGLQIAFAANVNHIVHGSRFCGVECQIDFTRFPRG